MTTTPQEMVETLATVLDGTMGLSLTDMKWDCTTMEELSELYVRTRSGEVFRLVCEPVDLATEFDPFEENDDA